MGSTGPGPSATRAAEPPSDSGGAVPARRHVRRTVWRALGAVALAALLWAVIAQAEAVAAGLRRMDPVAIVLAFALVLAGLAANLLSWRAVLAGLGSPLPLGVAGRVYLLAQLGKYVPGSVWPILAQAELGREHGVPALRSGVAGIAALIVGLCVGAVLAAVCLAGTATSQLREYAWGLVVVPLGLVALHPRVLQWVLDVAMRVLRRGGAPHRVSPRALVEAAAWSLVMWLLFGAQVWVLARSIGANGADLALLSLGAYAAAWVVGFLVVLAPAGAGPRELVLVLALGPVLPRAEALGLALVSRVLMLVGDLLGVLVAVAVARARRARPERA